MKSVKQILNVYRPENFISTKRIRFTGVGKSDVYNISHPFKIGRITYILGRVEERKSNFSKSVFFKRKKNSQYWEPDRSFPELKMEDPCIQFIKNRLIVGGVKTIVQKPMPTKYRMVFYELLKNKTVKEIGSGPWRMKDIRLIELPNKKIGVFTRPRGKKGRRGKIGFTIIDSLDKLRPTVISRAKLIKNNFARGEWGGVNQAIILKNGDIGILGHIARFSNDLKNRFYYPMVFSFNPNTGKTSTIRIILRRAELPEGEAKGPHLYNVIFPGGIIRDKKDCKLYVGVGDAESYEVTIKDPFKFYEQNYK